MEYSNTCKRCGKSFQFEKRSTGSYVVSSLVRKSNHREYKAQRAGYCSFVCQLKDNSKIIAYVGIGGAVVGVIGIILNDFELFVSGLIVSIMLAVIFWGVNRSPDENQTHEEEAK